MATSRERQIERDKQIEQVLELVKEIKALLESKPKGKK
jgi:hypothetical protein